ncbi:restriction endonuclease subunit S [Stutzerimonas stutzeri]|uniref:restriction endonuclease subunit S n=1 Tax=Stutzerimonas stutzeri TaxID=316 RepID=UPI0009E82E1A|nr:restriction endonuclease subunit S [Stutzerimonas stutzeri]
MSSKANYTSLGDICCDVSYGYTESATNEAVGPKFLRITDIQGGTFDWGSVPYCPATDVNAKKYALKVGDIVIARTGNSTGENAQLANEPPPAVFASYLIRFRPDASRVNPFFVGYQLRTERFRQYVLAVRSGSAQPGANAKQLGAFPVELIDRDLQDDAVEILRTLDDRITLLRETNATLEAIAQALFKSWFVDFDPVHAKAEGRQPEGMDATTAALFPDSFEESELGLVPKGWRYVSLKEVTAIFDSQRVPLSGQERDKRKGIYPYYGAAALMDWVDSYLFDGVYLLLGEDGSVADAAGYPVTQYVWGKIWVNNHAHVLQGKSGVTTEHLMLALQQTIITPYITGAVQAKLSQSNMWRIPFLRSSQEVSEAFGEAVTPLFISIRRNYEQAQTLTQLRDTLLPRLIAGQLRLPEVQALLNDRDTAQ